MRAVAGCCALVAAILVVSIAPAAAQPARRLPRARGSAEPPAIAPSAAASINPDTGLPSWHPPIAAPAQRQQAPARSGHDQAALARALRDRGRGIGLPFEAEAELRKFPRDAHGHCLGQGTNDPPKNVNLFHGWLGVNNEKAVFPPPRRDQSADGWFAERFGTWDWWKWRITPYPYRYHNERDECDPRNTPIPLLANLINFGALLLLFNWLGKKPLAEALKKRKSNIMGEIDRARAIKKSAQERLDRYQGELEALDDKLAELRQQYKIEGELEEKRLRQELRETEQRMLGDVAFRLDQEGKSMRDRLSREALEDALAAAEKLLGDAALPSDHERLCEEFLAGIGPALAGGGGQERAP